jgi:hypothetical protein
MSGEGTPGASRARDEPLSGFVRTDFILTFAIASDEARAALTELCASSWQGTRVTASTWEVTSALSPDALESAIVPLLSPGDLAVYYYLSDSKRIFRVVLRG